MALMNPSININGTSREALVADRRNVADALMEAMAALVDTKPHGRDYVGRDHQFSLDRRVYNERFAMLDKLRNEILEEALAIQEGK